MSRNLTARTWEAILSQETMDPFVLLLTISAKYAGNWSCIYLTNNSEDLLSNVQDGSTVHNYIAFPFQITLPRAEPGKISQVQLSVTNVSRELIDYIRNVEEAMVVNLYVINAEEPNVIVAQHLNYTWRGLQYNASTITGTISLEDYLSKSYPAELMTPSNFPGLFQ